MIKYCKAYKLGDLRKAPKWSDVAVATEKDLTDEEVVYILEDFTVTKNCLELDKEEDFLLKQIDGAWKEFCQSELNFEVPDWEEESKRVREELKKEGAID